MKRYFYFFLIVSFFVAGCNHNPCSSSSDLSTVTEAPVNTTVAGGYEPDSFTKQDHPEYAGSVSAFLILSEDGTIFLNHFPANTFNHSADSGSAKISGSGTWVFEKGKETINIKTSLSFKQTGIPQPLPFQLYKKGEKYYILIPFGDPDNCNAIRLVQQ